MSTWTPLVPVLAFFVAALTLGSGAVRVYAFIKNDSRAKDAGEAAVAVLTGLTTVGAFAAATQASDDVFSYPFGVYLMAILLLIAVPTIGFCIARGVHNMGKAGTEDSDSGPEDDLQSQPSTPTRK